VAACRDERFSGHVWGLARVQTTPRATPQYHINVAPVKHAKRFGSAIPRTEQRRVITRV
jgi:hypothetical protein